MHLYVIADDRFHCIKKSPGCLIQYYLYKLATFFGGNYCFSMAEIIALLFNLKTLMRSEAKQKMQTFSIFSLKCGIMVFWRCVFIVIVLISPLNLFECEWNA